MAGEEIVFGPFSLLPSQQLLLEGDRPVRLGSRALVILIALATRPGQLVGKEELMQLVWPDTFVEEANLRVHVAALRKALGDGRDGVRYLSNVPGRGYRFVAELKNSDAPIVRLPAAEARRHNLPAPLARMIGRDEFVDELVDRLQTRRLVSIVGPGGIGKTIVAVAVADRLASSSDHPVRFVDLGPLTDPLLIASALGRVLGVAVNSADPLPGLLASLREDRTLLVLDSCETVIDGVASLTEALLRGAPQLRILATSREPLRAEGEFVQRLPPLAFPQGTVGSAGEALRYPAVQLFVERAAASLDGFELTDADAAPVAEICRRLDGIALAIEVAAGRVNAFGVPQLAALLGDRFRLLMQGRRTALPRHQTLTATLDWSYQTLAEDERRTLRSLSVFAGSFDLEAARAVVAADAGTVIESIADLVAKSLVNADVSATAVRYRLGETTRVYAQAKLLEHGETRVVARRHAEFHRDVLAAAEADWRLPLDDAALESHVRRLDDVRTALDWAFGPDGDAAVGIDLSAVVVPLWMHLSLVDECQRRTERALAVYGDGAGPTRRSMQLQVALGLSLMFTTGAVAKTVAALTRGYDIARALTDDEYALRALWGLWVGRLNNGAIPESLDLAEEFARIAAGSTDPLDAAIGDRMIGFSLHFLGRPREARPYIESMLARDPGEARRSHPMRFQFDLWATARAALAEVMWLQGLPEQALRTARESVAEAEAVGHSVTLCNTLAKSSAVALLAGDFDTARWMIERLHNEASVHALAFWRAEAGCLGGVLRLKTGDQAGGLVQLRQELRGFPGNTLTVRYIAFLGKLADAQSRSGDFAGAHASIDEALERCNRNEERWWAAELLRVQGEILLRERGADAEAQAEELFTRSLGWAEGQGALAWELRTTMSLTQLWHARGHRDDARRRLAAVYGRFTEGLDSADCLAARRLIEALEP